MSNNASIAVAWTSFVSAMNQKAGRFDCYLNGPALPEEIADIERQMGMELPSELKELYRLNNGQNHQYGVIFGLDFLSVEDMFRRWSEWKELIESEGDEGLRELGEFCQSHPAGVIRPVYADTGWIPVLYDGAGNAIGFDMNPGPDGTPGQLINFGRDEDGKYVLASSLGEFIDRLTGQVDNLEVEIDEEDEDDVFFSLDSHAIDVFKKEACKKL